MLAKKKYAFPIAKIFKLDRAGNRTLLGVRFLWNTGEEEVAWEDRDGFTKALIAEEPIPAAGFQGPV